MPLAFGEEMIPNPFLIYIFTFALALSSYWLEWSDIYPPLSEEVSHFLIATFAISLALALPLINRLRQARRGTSGIPGWVVWPMLLGMLADIGYAGGIPFIMVMRGIEFDYSQFGIPTFHVVLSTFSSAFAAIRFSDYVVTRNRRYLVEALIPPLFAIVTFTRGTAMTSLITFGFIWLAHRGFPGFRAMFCGLVAMLGVLYVFGVLGDIRSPGAIEEVGQPSAKFRQSEIPMPYFWTYIYVSSPLANFQNTVDSNWAANGSATQFIVAEMLPDFVSKRVLDVMGAEREDVARVAPTLNASSLYSKAFRYASWEGPAWMFAVLSLLIMVYVFMTWSGPFAVPALSILNTLVLLCIFENMISFTGMIMQLFWPLLLASCFPLSGEVMGSLNHRFGGSADGTKVTGS